MEEVMAGRPDKEYLGESKGLIQSVDGEGHLLKDQERYGSIRIRRILQRL
jgi:hypothetical protein